MSLCVLTILFVGYFLLNKFMKLVNTFVFCVFIFVDTFSPVFSSTNSIETKTTGNLLTVTEKIFQGTN